MVAVTPEQPELDLDGIERRDAKRCVALRGEDEQVTLLDSTVYLEREAQRIDEPHVRDARAGV